MKKYVCLFLTALLLLAAGCAGAEEVVQPTDLGEKGVIIYHPEHNPFKHKYVYQIRLLYTDEDGQPITNQPLDFLISNSPTERVAPLPIMTGGDVAQLNELTTNSNGEINLRFPVLNNDGSDFLKGFSNTSVYIWSKYKNQTDNEWQMQRELLRLPSPPTVASMEALFSQGETQVVEETNVEPQYAVSEAEWTTHLKVRITNADGTPYTGQVWAEFNGKSLDKMFTATESGVIIAIPDVYNVPGICITLRDGNRTKIADFPIPGNTEQVSPSQGIIATPESQPQLPTAAPTIAYENKLPEEDTPVSSAVQKGGLLKGWSETLVGILAVVCLVIYLGCWLVLKFPDKFGLGNQGKGV